MIEIFRDYIDTGREIEFTYDKKEYSITYYNDNRVNYISFCEFYKEPINVQTSSEVLKLKIGSFTLENIQTLAPWLHIYGHFSTTPRKKMPSNSSSRPPSGKRTLPSVHPTAFGRSSARGREGRACRPSNQPACMLRRNPQGSRRPCRRFR